MKKKTQLYTLEFKDALKKLQRFTFLAEQLMLMVGHDHSELKKTNRTSRHVTYIPAPLGWFRITCEDAEPAAKSKAARKYLGPREVEVMRALWTNGGSMKSIDALVLGGDLRGQTFEALRRLNRKGYTSWKGYNVELTPLGREIAEHLPVEP